MEYKELLEKYKLLQIENNILRDEIAKLNAKLIKVSPSENHAERIYKAIINIKGENVSLVTNNSSSKEKIELFLSLFRGREDVCAKRWKNKLGYSPYCFSDFKPGICNKPKIKCTECKNSNFAPLNSEQLQKHLTGEVVLGLYPMTKKDTCYLLVMDLDEARWQDDSNVIRNVYGLTATPIRKDGHHPIIFMQCGPVRYKVDAKQEAKQRSFDHFVVPRFTSARMPISKEEKDWHITEIYQYICESNYRNELIVKDIEEAINSGRNPLVLTERTSHIDILVKMLNGKDFQVIVLSGELTAKKRKEALDKIKALKNGDRYVILATGKLIGEGFDEARLDTLFMAMPIAWKGTIAQYAGRLHRNYEGKNEVIIYDYVDVHIPVLERMYHKRLTAYRSVGYSIKSNIMDSDTESRIYDC